MKLLTYSSPSGPRVAALRKSGETAGQNPFLDPTAAVSCVDLNQADPRLPATMKELLAQGADALRRAADALAVGKPSEIQTRQLLAPVPDPQKVICVGLNYADHAKESGAAI